MTVNGQRTCDATYDGYLFGNKLQRSAAVLALNADQISDLPWTNVPDVSAAETVKLFSLATVRRLHYHHLVITKSALSVLSVLCPCKIFCLRRVV